MESKKDIKLPSSLEQFLMNENNSSIDTSWSSPRLTCPVCTSYEYENYQLLDKHMRKNHPDFKICCDKCNKTFKLYSVLSLHNYKDHANNDENYFKLDNNNDNNMVYRSGSSGYGSSESQEEEEEEDEDEEKEEKKDIKDAPDDYVREMILHNEFSCRLCKNVFPNLRALKGHISKHLFVAPGTPLSCIICPHTSFNPIELKSHLNSHNGPKPYKCSVCNLTFTTKANCERHIRDQHDVKTRVDVMRVLIYDPSEKTAFKNIGKTPTTSPKSKRTDSPIKVQKICNYENDKQRYDNLNINDDIPLKDNSSKKVDKITALNHFEENDLIIKRVDPIIDDVIKESIDYHGNYWSLNNVNVVNINNSDDVPLDLSMQTLDLSLKSKNDGIDLSKKADFERNYGKTQYSSPIQVLSYTGRDNNQQNSFYGNIGGDQVWRQAGVDGASFVAPYLYNYPYLFNQDIIMRENKQISLARTMQLTSGGGSNIVKPTIDYENFAASLSPYTFYENTLNSSASPILSSGIGKLQSQNLQQMVIGDDVSPPKKKQRRSEAQGLHECPICSACFTIKSNMNRHIRSKHPSNRLQV